MEKYIAQLPKMTKKQIRELRRTALEWRDFHNDQAAQSGISTKARLAFVKDKMAWVSLAIACDAHLAAPRR